MLLRTTSRTFGDAVIVDCAGKIVLGEETAFLHHQVKDLLNESRYLVLNLAQVAYIDSSGVGELVSLFASAQRSGARIVLAALTGRVKDVLQITKLATIFDTYDSAEEAAESFKPRAGLTTEAEFAG
ncbi:MAG: STAS domain-containing protein [Acidobacteriia bacterium]|nr:STAS domain-containing protein [Terriglobia bacterium]